MSGGIVEFLSPEQKRQFVERHFALGNPGKALAEVTDETYNIDLQTRAERLLEGDEFVRSLIAQVTNIVSNDMASMKAESAEVLADIRERSMDMEKPNAAVMAEVARGKVLGLYTDPKERSAEVLRLLEVNKLTEDQLESIVGEMQKLPKDIRKHLALMIYDPEVEDLASHALIDGEAVSA